MADYDWLVAQLEDLVDAKATTSELTARLTACQTEIERIQSDVSDAEVGLRTIEQGLLDLLTALP
jgi:predicted  nucleic acid-binding Zn-ribbon protein